MNTFTWFFLFLLAASTLLQLWLIARQNAYLKRHARTVPEAFAEVITADEHARAADYARARIRPAAVGVLLSAALALAWTLGGGLDALGLLVSTRFSAPLEQGAALVGAVVIVGGLIELPLDIWRTFGIEAAFGFNRTTVKRFVMDRLLGLALLVTLGGLLLVAVLWIMAGVPRHWWLVAWGVWAAFSLLMTWAVPRFIAPLFNRFTPLGDDQMRERLENLLDRCGFRSGGLFVMDGSKRSAHGNAYFTGFGKSKRVVFFDTLLEQLAPEELEAVLAHELGHFRRRHVQKGLVLSMVLSLGAFGALGWLAEQAWFFQGLGVSVPGDGAAIVLLMILAPLVGTLVGPVFSGYSRRHEFEADAYAVQQTDGEALIGGLVKLYRGNASALVADPLYAAAHFSHPAPAERVAHIRSLATVA